ncbi:hypothetical protein CYLTODRAFT_453808 [Cylindrobasidium torrendii FP15055 ss-10]|uniref:Uncharacterized protein n=1 Tax=Cylindrobasidium torrendii FP15055 ss-10 TaxID=1314674 RepID=A0A0D7BC62_9AGAR|nr:hypothetical protein CYLTODRAFT_453808 [Cylindrobasidium torrendii FP15055 ss-10]
MTILHREQDISLSPMFVEPVEIRLIEPDSGRLRDFECFAGLWDGEFWKYCRKPLNKIQVQPSLQFCLGGRCAFVPCDPVLRRIFALYRHNKECDVTARQRFDEIPEISTSVYQVATLFGTETRLFTRHPTTNIVTEHKYPYTTLPQFSLSVHPCLALLASTMVTTHESPFSLAREIQTFTTWSSFSVDCLPSFLSRTDSRAAPRGSPATMASTHSRKRQVPDDAENTRTRETTHNPHRAGRTVLGVKHMNTHMSVTAQAERPTKRPRVVFEDVPKAMPVVKKRVLPQRAVWR